MGSAHRSTTGLRLLDAQHMVELGGTSLHQDELRWYVPPLGGPPTQVEVELLPAPIRFGPQAGWWGLEARIDGYRVGELTLPEAGWYRPLVDGVLRSGGRPGVEAHVVLDGSGTIGVELYFPVVEPYPAAPPPRPAEPTPSAVHPRAVRAGGPVPLWMGVLAAALLLVMVTSLAVDRITRTDPITAEPAPETRLALAAELPAPSIPAPPAPTAPPSSSAVPTPTTAAPPVMAPATAKPRIRNTTKRLAVVAKPKRSSSTAAEPSSRTTRKPSERPEPSDEPTSTTKAEPSEQPEPSDESDPTSEPDPDDPTEQDSSPDTED